MENFKLYKSKYKYINRFFWSNHIIFMKDNTENDEVLHYDKVYHNQKYSIQVLKYNINHKRKFEILKNTVFSKIDAIDKPDYLYVVERFELKNDLYLSKTLDIQIKKLDEKIKIDFIVYHYFKIKDLIYRQGLADFFLQYRLAGVNELIDKTVKHCKNSIEDYLYICTIKNIIRIYQKEVDQTIDCNNPTFSDKMIFNYLENYFSKYIVIDYDYLKVKDFISNYYVTDVQSEDKIMLFLENFLSLYKIVTGIKLTYEKNNQVDCKRMHVFHNRKASDIKFKNFYIYFDKLVKKEENYNNMMFLLEILEFTENLSRKKKIANYISALELLLVKGDKKISFQISEKCMKVLNQKGYSFDEFRFIYDYRSKIVHGDYKKSIEILYQLYELEPYQLSDEEMAFENYLNLGQTVEEKIKKRLFFVLKETLKLFIFKNEYLMDLKNSLNF